MKGSQATEQGTTVTQVGRRFLNADTNKQHVKPGYGSAEEDIGGRREYETKSMMNLLQFCFTQEDTGEEKIEIPICTNQNACHGCER